MSRHGATLKRMAYPMGRRQLLRTFIFSRVFSFDTNGAPAKLPESVQPGDLDTVSVGKTRGGAGDNF